MVLVVPCRAQQNQREPVERFERCAPVYLDQFQPRRCERRTEGGNLKIVLESVSPARAIAGEGICTG